MSEMSKNTKATLCYVGAWITGLIFLLIEKKDKEVRFHAMQSLLTFAGLTILTMVPLIGWILAPIVAVVGFILWLILIIKTYQGEKVVLPLVGEIAKKQVERMK
ncbi:DUF4870 domain-containing protein [Patescibacteria group bacterium]